LTDIALYNKITLVNKLLPQAQTELDAFDKCPNRTLATDIKPGSLPDEATPLTLTCPKYPDGTPLSSIGLYEVIVERVKMARRLGCVGCKFSKEDAKSVDAQEALERLHPDISEHCGTLYTHEYYPEAALKGFKIVKERLRELTGFERATDAFGKGGLYINGSAAEHVDTDFQNAAKYLMMAIDSLRNEGSHTTYGNVTGSERAVEYLTLSSLAMHLLDSAEIRE